MIKREDRQYVTGGIFTKEMQGLEILQRSQNSLLYEQAETVCQVGIEYFSYSFTFFPTSYLSAFFNSVRFILFNFKFLRAATWHLNVLSCHSTLSYSIVLLSQTNSRYTAPFHSILFYSILFYFIRC